MTRKSEVFAKVEVAWELVWPFSIFIEVAIFLTSSPMSSSVLR